MMFNRVKHTYNMVAIILLNIIILFVVVEAASAVIWHAYGYLQSDKQAGVPYKYDARERLSYYRQQEWSMDYWKEQIPYTCTRQPYVEQKCEPQRGNLVNVDESGLRITPSYTEEDHKSLSIFCFGGSTMFGIGSPDWGTIPACLAEILNSRYSEESTEVINFGQGYWISSQEVIQLIQEIKHDNIPDIAIFYDGINDVGFSYKACQADVPYSHPDDVPYSHPLISPVTAKETGFQTFMKLCANLNCVKVVEGGLRKIFGYQQLEPPKPVAGEEVDVDKLSHDIVSIYLHNMDIVDALSKQYGFDYYFFWQPSLYEESKPLTSEEEGIKRSLVSWCSSRTPGLIELRHATYSLIKSEAAKRDNLYYIADIFNHRQDFVYSDGAHITPEGNRIVAERIASIIADSVARVVEEAR